MSSSGSRRTVASDVETLFAGRATARRLYAAVERAVAAAGASSVRVTKSQVAFSRRRGFAWAWTPDRWLRGKTAPLVLSIALSRRDGSPRWKEIVEPRPGRFMHHLELRSTREVDAEVRSWLAEAWAQATPRSPLGDVVGVARRRVAPAPTGMSGAPSTSTKATRSTRRP